MVAIVLPTMHQLGAAIVMALAIVMVPWGGLAITIIMTTTMTTMTMMMAGNVAGSAAGE